MIMAQARIAFATTVRDPVCGMVLTMDEAAATRTSGGDTLYFCSERCVQQYDRAHAASATTGVGGALVETAGLAQAREAAGFGVSQAAAPAGRAVARVESEQAREY